MSSNKVPPHSHDTKPVSIVRFTAPGPARKWKRETCDDTVASESPLEIRIVFGPRDKRKDRSLSITMCTPGDHQSLAAGFLFSEGVLWKPSDIEGFEHCGPIAEGEADSNQLRVNLAAEVDVDLSRLQRHFYTTSSCGVCGKASIDAVLHQGVQPVSGVGGNVKPEVILQLPELLQARQRLFGRTGGLHAAGLFSLQGEMIDIREDVGRHNAVDKLVGAAFIAAKSQQQFVAAMSRSVLVVSGRSSFELVQKAVTAHIPVMAAVGAPSSLAVDLAERMGLTLIGFNDGTKFNIYSHRERVTPTSPVG